MTPKRLCSRRRLVQWRGQWVNLHLEGLRHRGLWNHEQRTEAVARKVVYETWLCIQSEQCRLAWIISSVLLQEQQFGSDTLWYWRPRIVPLNQTLDKFTNNLIVSRFLYHINQCTYSRTRHSHHMQTCEQQFPAQRDTCVSWHHLWDNRSNFTSRVIGSLTKEDFKKHRESFTLSDQVEHDPDCILVYHSSTTCHKNASIFSLCANLSSGLRFLNWYPVVAWTLPPMSKPTESGGWIRFGTGVIWAISIPH